MFSTLFSTHPSRFIMVLTLLALIGCSSDSPTNPDDGGINNNDTPIGTFSCSIDGTTLALTNGTGTHNHAGWYLLYAFSPIYDELYLSMPDTEGTYSLSTLNEPFLSVIYNSRAYGINGTLIVTDVSTTNAKGTFSGTAINVMNPTDSITITDGVFNVPITITP